MLRELLSIFRADDPLAKMGTNYAKMLELTREMTLSAGRTFLDGGDGPDSRSRIYDQDVKVNKLEREIRKQVVAHLSIDSNSMDLPYCLVLIGLVKDVERIGDYAKNLAELVEIHPDPLPDDELAAELREIRVRVEEMFAAAIGTFEKRDAEAAADLIRGGRADAHRCDALLVRVARGPHAAAVTTVLVLALRYYKRIGGHLLNVLSSMVMPLHKVDFFDEDAAPAGRAGSERSA
jgi:phosphate uptake regulator